jgi:putative ABC transport system permease protein
MVLIKIIKESFSQAFSQITGNKLRSSLSLLGVTIGVICIVGVQSLVSSLENNVTSSIKKLGDNVIYVQKFPWQTEGEFKWWEIIKRPNVDYDDFMVVENDVKSAAGSYFTKELRGKTIKFEGKSIQRATGYIMTYDMPKVTDFSISQGRYYTESEYNFGSDKIILGNNLSEALFGIKNPLGRKVSLNGRKFEVIGVIEKSGDDIVDFADFDDAFVIGYETARKFLNLKNVGGFGSSIIVKAKDGVGLDQLEDDLTGMLRRGRRLRPIEETDFSLNRITILSSLMDNIFGSLSFAGGIIGLLSIVVGGVSVANIMFVSVKERTSIIGVKKALGAKRSFILMEFLIEAVLLCLIGGALGIIVVVAGLPILSDYIPFELNVNTSNVVLGVIISVVSGVLSGIIPAYMAAKLDPVIAIRQ